LGTCGGCPGQIWPLGDIFLAKGTSGSPGSDRQDQRSFFKKNTPIFIGFQGEITSFLLSPGTLRGHYGPCESPTTFQCQVVEIETVAQTDRSLELPPVVGAVPG